VQQGLRRSTQEVSTRFLRNTGVSLAVIISKVVFFLVAKLLVIGKLAKGVELPK
jgi:hypothetical protein